MWSDDYVTRATDYSKIQPEKLTRSFQITRAEGTFKIIYVDSLCSAPASFNDYTAVIVLYTHKGHMISNKETTFFF